MKRHLTWAMLLAAGFLFVAAPVEAVTLTNLNTTLTVADVGSNPGNDVTQWTVDGVNQYGIGAGSWFYRVGAGPVVSLNTATFVSQAISTPSGDPFDLNPSTLTTVYQDRANNVQFTMQYQVYGSNAGSGTSTVSAQLMTALLVPQVNAPATALSIFELNDLALGGSDVNNIVVPSALESERKINQSGASTLFGEMGTFRLTGTGASLLVSDPTHRQAGAAGTVRASVLGGILNDTPPGGVAIGPTDVAYAYEYDFALVAGTAEQSYEVDVARNLSAAPEAPTAVPEPVSALLGLIGLAALGGVAAGRRRTV